MWATEPGSRFPRPVKSPTLPMPSQDRLRLHQTEVLSPTFRPEAAKPDPEDSIRSPEARMRIGAQGDLELVAEDQVLEGEIPRERIPATNVRSTRRSNSGIRQNSNLPLRQRARRTGSTYAALRHQQAE